MKNKKRSQARSAVIASICAVFGATFGASLPTQAQTVIANGGVTVHNPNGTTTSITNSGVTTTKHNGTVTTVRTHKTVIQRSGGGTRSGGSVTLNENDRTTTIRSKHGSVTINGNGNRVTITGTCARLFVTGNHNRIITSRVAAIDVPGNNNTVRWQSGATGGRSVPSITQLGSGNNVSRQ